jgi:hypothetical protein
LADAYQVLHQKQRQQPPENPITMLISILLTSSTILKTEIINIFKALKAQKVLQL